MPIRNPFARQRPGSVIVGQHQQHQQQHDENGNSSRPGSSPVAGDAGFERQDTVGSSGSNQKASLSVSSSGLSIRSGAGRRSQDRDKDTGEYKMSVVNDSGVYLPPSPTEKEATWPRRYLSRASSDAKSAASGGEIEHFSISRESFDSYRRSFDICAKSPVATIETALLPPRASLDSAAAASRQRFSSSRFPPRSRFGREEQQAPTPEESFEDVGLNDDSSFVGTKPAAPKKKGGFFSKFGGGSDSAPAQAQAVEGTSGGSVSGQQQSTSTMSRFLPLSSGRKRGQSLSGGGQGAELGAMGGERRAAGTVVLQEQEVQS
ncbi:hypothetical protein QBC47DRAFT_374047 [Echria macrotheca]|uniref:Uncharacterized protein n=1 Tax=Echria macrotheca TaxID=438768 RepID=A0AAJ0BH95_9PEZI|nr:hypothetical protein QBC47DRAFT_374047 [Echria macrotheca]